MKKLIALLVLLSSYSFSTAQTLSIAVKPEEVGISSARLERMDKMLQDYVATQKVPGAVAFIARKGKIVYHKAFGAANTDTKSPLKKDNIFRLASQTKAVTSLAVMMLWEEGKFFLDDNVSKYIPEFKKPKVLVNVNWGDSTFTSQPAKSEITIRQLLTHTSGIDYAVIGSQEMRAIYAKAGVPAGITTDKIFIGDKMKILAGLPLKHHPGEQFTYGLNTDVLGYLVEVLSGMTLDQYFKTKIFQPLGMNDTYFYLPQEKYSRLVALHQFKDGNYMALKGTVFGTADADFPNFKGSYFSGGAGLSSTIEDYAKFLQFFLNQGTYNGVRLLSRKTVELMLTNQIQTPINTQFGLGFGLETSANDYESIVSSGTFSWGGAFNTSYWADPQEKIVALIYTNIYASDSGGIAEKFKTLTYQAVVD
jgi:CubicO group peptidase (beta-lactamase class C family)